ncbi:MATH domain and coiled-coil domain-containing protein [Prunus yedoensis var. nudiflora]|uniref:MATH domain and coiled-coil domain-containing protein n=1 Tax=Prunus yedoensis var. nudiflora TaxID=2094558 RepID=A0A314ZWC2_PRUYE|nr:MATH domain and coiled-coil domain-containing protein [Prunus yedoensis var. nudiflora]
MENQQVGEFVSKTFTWTIENFSKLNNQKLYSEVFLIGDWKWRILIFPKGNNVKQLSVYLEVVDASDLPFLWTRYAEFSLTVVDQLNSNKSITKDSKHGFNSSESDWGFTSFMPLSELCDSNKGFLRNDKCIIEADVSVRKVDIKILEDQGTGSSATIEPSEQEDQGQEPSSVDSVQVPHSSVTTPSSEQVVAFQDAPSSRQVFIEPTDSYVDPSTVKEHDKLPFTPVGKLMDFRGLGKIEKVFIPLLEEVKDMTEDACEHLQILWEELETFKFDLAWLEPSVQTALNLKKLVERAGQVQKQREDVDALEIEVKRLKARLAVAEIDLEVAKRDLAKAEVGFGNDTDMNRELGYGRH